MSANWHLPAFYDTAREVTSSVPPHDTDLRDIIVDIISKHPTVITKGRILQLTKEYERLGSAIFAKLLENNMVRESEAERDGIVESGTLNKTAQKLTYYDY